MKTRQEERMMETFRGNCVPGGTLEHQDENGVRKLVG
jgi:hypothetical protein